MRQYTSQLALEQHAATIETYREKVLFMIQESDEAEGITNREIATALKMETASVSASTRHLVLEGKVRELKKRKDKVTGNFVIAWTTLPKNNQPTLHL